MLAAMSGTLYVVATPIGNLKDITLRALDTLQSVSLIACEDTRHTRKLTSHYDIHTSLTSYYGTNEAAKRTSLITKLQDGQDIALVSDAGTPGVSDPGYTLIRDAVEADVPVVVVPGASAAITGLVASGLPMHRFRFVGFLPQKSIGRKRALEELANSDETVVAYESPHRLVRCLQDLVDVMPTAAICVVREQTKLYEEVRRGCPEELLSHFKQHQPKGECLLVIAPK